MLKKLLDGKLVKFLIVGVVNTLIGAAIHFRLSENRTKLLEDRSLDTLRSEMP